MLSVEESENLISKLLELQNKYEESKSAKDKVSLIRHEKICIEKMSYLVSMKTYRYRTFSNYDDLNQDGMEALVMAIRSYRPNKGNFFWWAHKYIDTRISRCANAHTAVKYPLHVAKEITPRKITHLASSVCKKNMEIFVDKDKSPEEHCLDSQITNIINSELDKLPTEKRQVMSMFYGLEDNDPMTINKVCSILNIPRTRCVKIINESIKSMQQFA